MLEAIALHKSFGSYNALADMNFAVEPGKVLCLLGANGAGKSTTLNLFLNFIAPTSGTALIGGIDAQAQPELARSHLMYLPEQMNLYNNFTAIENVEYLASLAGIKTPRAAVIDALERVGLQSSFHQQRLSTYSKGMRQKVGIALAMLKNAKALLLDEPTSGLDPSATREFVEVINSLTASGTAVLMVTHDFYCALSLADEIMILQKGETKTRLAVQGLTLPQLESAYFQILN